MRFRGREQSQNVEDRRGSGRRIAATGGGIGLLVMALLIWFLGGNPQRLLQQQAQVQQAAGRGANAVQELSPEETERGELAKVVFRDSEKAWSELFAENGIQYRNPTLVLYTGQTMSGCGGAQASTGPFYCPADEKVYLDTSFFTQLDRQLGAPGDFAQAYVIAHEFGHHIQKLLGKTALVDQIRQQRSKAEANDASVRLELQADFYAGVMLHHAQQAEQIIEAGDIEEALRAATAIGDDRLQKQSQGFVVPESFTHGTSEQRLHWFMKGLETGDLRQGDTFSVREL